jgi:hypothetical protein
VRGQLIPACVRIELVIALSLTLPACSKDADRQDVASNGNGPGGPASSTTSTGSTVDTSTGSTPSTGSTATGAGGSGMGGDASTPGSGGSGNEGGGAGVGDAADEPPACDDQRGMPATCVPPPGDGGCSSVTSYCERLGSYLKPVVHNQVASCIRDLATCDDSQAARCVKTALFGACDDGSADYTCADISRVCANTVPTTIEECDAFLKGMTAPGRQAVLICLAPPDGTPPCPAGIFACIRKL